MERFLAHNLHWQSVDLFFAQDPQLYRLNQFPLIHKNVLIDQLPCVIPGIYTLAGGRQIGKTTLLKQWMKSLLQKNIDPNHIVFITGEMIVDYHQLVHMLQDYIAGHPFGSRLFIIIDEITYIKGWDQGIKYLADVGSFENAVVLLTGSDMRVMKEARMRFPGRRGAADKVDFHLYPLSFYECVRLKHSDFNGEDIDLLHNEFDFYLQHGGFLTAINDWERSGKISPSTYRTYTDWIRGDILNSGKKENNLREILTALMNTYGTQVSWNSLCDHTSLQHHDSIRDYVEVLESMDVLMVQYALSEDKLLAAPKKAKKIHFKDPFIYQAVRSWIPSSKNDDQASILPLLAESCVVSQFQRFYPCFYIKAEGEVDLAYVYQDRFFPVEIKWTNQIRPKDLKQVSKYNNAIVLSKHKEPSRINGIRKVYLPLHLYDSYIRDQLDVITEMPYSGTQKIKDVELFLNKKIINIPDRWDKLPHFPLNINCFAYALGLGDSQLYRETVHEGRNVSPDRYFASSKFMQFLLKKNKLNEMESPSIGDLVLYFDEYDEPKHAGIVKQVDSGLIIESKWGTIDAIFSHKKWRVPKSYGTKIKYYTSLEMSMAEKYFLEYCEEIQK